ncbi:polyadenylate-binding protein-interacting protein 2B-like [Mizuhopecten yessoensis]|uniref:Polyadenylate-binding protein-interacting protein 2B n=1 Tax=Mizuhopecten yessoensis TaxID=6573 RepID=A0A210QKL3_MIZYE|nr:polyadenylate-binding protein-interacting protein 2B-like [Mizuhopecten yessoensis]OWF49262.1 Polyadenylate-binding protein-interacting protein 2B [Mizuhopecten yessoensis]
MNMKLPPYLQNSMEQIHEEAPGMGPEVDFSEYVWMGEELDEFDKQVEEEFWEEAYMDACFEEMLAEEEAEWIYFNSVEEAVTALYNYNNNLHHHKGPSPCSKLNPDAPEFVPRSLNSTFKFT